MSGSAFMRPTAVTLVSMVRFLVGAYPRWVGCAPEERQRIYFANHTSHVDTLAIWSALPRGLRERTHPVAARDYWGSGFRKYVATRTLGAVLIDRTREDKTVDPLAPLLELLAQGESLILFPEGTRGPDALPRPFKSGLFRLAQAMPHVELVPVYLENLHRSMPRGAFFPIPLTCTVRFGTPLAVVAGEEKEQFLARAREEVVRLSGAAS
jgi:1-acyl-sn-glycerol-3-phosphate acyltransferase